MTNIKTATADEIIQRLESIGLGWFLDHTGNMIEARIWDWPTVIGRYRPAQVEPLADMLRAALTQYNAAGMAHSDPKRLGVEQMRDELAN